MGVESVATCSTGSCTGVSISVGINYIGRCTGSIGHAVEVVIWVVIVRVHNGTVVGQRNAVRIPTGDCIHPSTCKEAINRFQQNLFDIQLQLTLEG